MLVATPLSGSAAPPGKISICHANPPFASQGPAFKYELITISVNGLSGHADHTNDIIPAPVDANGNPFCPTPGQPPGPPPPGGPPGAPPPGTPGALFGPSGEFLGFAPVTGGPAFFSGDVDASGGAGGSARGGDGGRGGSGVLPICNQNTNDSSWDELVQVVDEWGYVVDEYTVTHPAEPAEHCSAGGAGGAAGDGGISEGGDGGLAFTVG